MLESLFQTYDSVIVLDTETTGVNCKSDEIIELGFLRLDRAGERTEEDYLIRLSPGRRLPPVITQLTGIREDELFQNGVEKDVAAEAFVRSLAGEKPLVCAYNAQFDLCFLFYFLHRLGCDGVLQKAQFLDIMAIYKDRRDYPHKLCNAVESYGVDGVNSHRAVDDAVTCGQLLRRFQRRLHGAAVLFAQRAGGVADEDGKLRVPRRPGDLNGIAGAQLEGLAAVDGEVCVPPPHLADAGADGPLGRGHKRPRHHIVSADGGN